MTADQIQMLRHGLLASEWCGFTKVKMVHELCDLALKGLSVPPEGRDISGLLHAARNAESKLRYMGTEFNRPNFTDRYGDGPIMLSMADELKKQIKLCEPQVGSKP